MASNNIDSDMDALPGEAEEAKPIDKISKELAGIRKRRNTTQKDAFHQPLKTGLY